MPAAATTTTTTSKLSLLTAFLVGALISWVALQLPQSQQSQPQQLPPPTNQVTLTSTGPQELQSVHDLLLEAQDILQEHPEQSSSSSSSLLQVAVQNLQSARHQLRRLPECDYAESTPVFVGVYYYPWWGNTNENGSFHNGQTYLRRDLDPPQRPKLGEYDDSDPAIIEKHLKWSKRYNIGLWVTSWWGPDSQEDIRIRDVILPAMTNTKYDHMKVALHYETENRLRKRLENGDREWTLEKIEGDMQHMCEEYFGNDNYLRIDGRPVIFVYLTRVLDDLDNPENDQVNFMQQAIMNMRAALAAQEDCGFYPNEDLYVVCDHVFWLSPELDAQAFQEELVYCDAITNYDVYGSMMYNFGRNYAGETMPNSDETFLEHYYREQAEWRDVAADHGTRYIPTVAPGFNDRSLRPENDRKALARSLTENDVEGSLFEAMLDRAVPLVDRLTGNLLMVNSYNEFHEDTQIEPVVCTAGNDCSGGTTEPGDPEGVDYTNGINYEAYNMLYLQILKQKTYDIYPEYI